MMKWCRIIFAIILFYSLFVGMMQVLSINFYVFRDYFGLWEIPAKVAAVIASLYVFCLLVKFLPLIIAIFICSLVLVVNVWHWSLWVSVLILIWPVIVVLAYCVLTKSLKYNTSDF
ncbi:hypothetical protein EAE90_02645 [Photorhabdus caribbeanensis]|uniref:Uncharacterized protein n=3 Tax=Photorhabdus TaxID=29487 RepID=A0A022PH17_9GAMM|nr:hypothetical protein BA1DRAFT_02077 [Photorhabdus aegyptia]MBS9422664.1 hypothetical protein [Photorhabdus caribbeanensis]MBS9428781.1 hypothetical protein [Photorhabdus akhurstii]